MSHQLLKNTFQSIGMLLRLLFKNLYKPNLMCENMKLWLQVIHFWKTGEL